MLKAPYWAEKLGAIPTNRGWVSPTTGELLISRKHSERQLVEWREANGVVAEEPTKEPTEAEKLAEELAVAQALATDQYEDVTAAPVEEPALVINTPEDSAIDFAEVLDGVDLESMTKAQIDEWAKVNLDIDLDGRKSKAVMIETINDYVNGE